MSLERAKRELESASEFKHDLEKSLVFVRLTLYEIIEYLEGLKDE